MDLQASKAPKQLTLPGCSLLHAAVVSLRVLQWHSDRSVVKIMAGDTRRTGMLVPTLLRKGKELSALLAAGRVPKSRYQCYLDNLDVGLVIADLASKKCSECSGRTLSGSLLA